MKVNCEMTDCIWNDGKECDSDEITIIDNEGTEPYCQAFDEHGGD